MLDSVVMPPVSQPWMERVNQSRNLDTYEADFAEPSSHPVRARIDRSSMTTATFAHYTANPQWAKPESLRQAMLKVMPMPQYSHPAYWAPYALVGDGGR